MIRRIKPVGDGTWYVAEEVDAKFDKFELSLFGFPSREAAMMAARKAGYEVTY